MSENKNQITPISKVRNYLADINVKKRFEEILGKHAGAFINSIVNVVNGNDKLLAIGQSNPQSIMTSALRAATMLLSIDPALGQAAIVPYGNAAVFQIMYKGVTQLCIRSGQYATIHCTEVYADEIKFHNPLTGEVVFNDPATFKMRYADKDKNIVGHYAHFELLSGFIKSDYMSTGEAMAHGRKYSKSYQYDLRDHKQTSKWSTDPVPMCNKTVLLRLLTKYGVMSIEIQDALVADSEDAVDFSDAQDAATKQIDGQSGSKLIDANFEIPGEPDPATKAKAQAMIDNLKADEAGQSQQPHDNAPPAKLPYYCPACDTEHPYQKGNKCPMVDKDGNPCTGKLIKQ